MRMHMPTRPSTHMPARTRKHTHADQCVILNAFPRQLIRKRASVLRYTYIACFVSFAVTQHPKSSLGLFIVKVSRSHAHTHTR
jgi:hypothetical protein